MALLVSAGIGASCAARAPSPPEAVSPLEPKPADPELYLDPFLKPYVAELEAETPKESLDRIAQWDTDELYRLHHGYGTWIRNKWLWGDRDPVLVGFLRKHGYEEPDSMSGVLIMALWADLNAHLTPAEQARRERVRATVAKKMKLFRRLEDECGIVLRGWADAFARCYAQHGLPSANPVGRDPFYKLLIGKSGTVDQIVFFDGASPAVQECLRPLLMNFGSTPIPFDEPDHVTLYITSSPNCRAAERDSL